MFFAPANSVATVVLLSSLGSCFYVRAFETTSRDAALDVIGHVFFTKGQLTFKLCMSEHGMPQTCYLRIITIIMTCLIYFVCLPNGLNFALID